MRVARESITASIALATVAKVGQDPCGAAKWYRHVLSSHEFCTKMFRGSGGWDKQLKKAREELPGCEAACKQSETREPLRATSGRPDMWTEASANQIAWVVAQLHSRKVTAQAAGCLYIEEIFYRFTKRADGRALLPTVNALVRESGTIATVVGLAKEARTHKVRQECLRALAAFPQHAVYQDFLWKVDGLQGLMSGNMQLSQKQVLEGADLNSNSDGHRQLVSVNQPLHVYILRIAFTAIASAKQAPEILLQMEVIQLCVKILQHSPNTEAIKGALLTLCNLAAKGYAEQVKQANTTTLIGRRGLGSHISSDIRHLAHIFQTNMKQRPGRHAFKVAMDDAVGCLVVIPGLKEQETASTAASDVLRGSPANASVAAMEDAIHRSFQVESLSAPVSEGQAPPPAAAAQCPGGPDCPPPVDTHGEPKKAGQGHRRSKHDDPTRWLSHLLMLVTLAAPIAGWLSYRHKCYDAPVTRPLTIETNIAAASHSERSRSLTPGTPSMSPPEEIKRAFSEGRLEAEGDEAEVRDSHVATTRRSASLPVLPLSRRKTAEASDSHSKVDSPSVSLECVVCHDADKQAAFFPCGHRCVCIPCAKLIYKRKTGCPICRGKIAHYARIYDT